MQTRYRYEADEFLADSDLLARIIHPDDRSIFLNHRHQVEKEPAEIEFRILHPDGTCRWISHICQPAVDKAGRFLGTRGSNRDVTTRKRAEGVLKKVSDDLVRSNNELRQFTFGIAHDLLNPLNVIAGCIYLFEQQYKGKLGSQFDDLVTSSSEFNKIKKFVHDLLAYAKIEMRSQDFYSVDLSSVVDDTLNTLQQDIKESGAAVKHDKLSVVIADSEVYQQFTFVGHTIKPDTLSALMLADTSLPHGSD